VKYILFSDTGPVNVLSILCPAFVDSLQNLQTSLRRRFLVDQTAARPNISVEGLLHQSSDAQFVTAAGNRRHLGVPLITGTTAGRVVSDATALEIIT
jgi:hypothetical protein